MNQIVLVQRFSTAQGMPEVYFRGDEMSASRRATND